MADALWLGGLRPSVVVGVAKATGAVERAGGAAGLAAVVAPGPGLVGDRSPARTA